MAIAKSKLTAAERATKPLIDFVTLGGARVQAFVLYPGDNMPGFGGSSRGLLVGRTPSLVTRWLDHGTQQDTEHDLDDHAAWARLLDLYRAAPGARPVFTLKACDARAETVYGPGAQECTTCGRVYAADDLPPECDEDCPTRTERRKVQVQGFSYYGLDRRA